MHIMKHFTPCKSVHKRHMGAGTFPKLVRLRPESRPKRPRPEWSSGEGQSAPPHQLHGVWGTASGAWGTAAAEIKFDAYIVKAGTR